ncbi:phasin family protein [Desulfobacter latus]|uniref:Phasin family protein n=1 Tax=Desulfobacter latus TaxID=2292 RepID=A0A850T2Z2_9BACT|nr:phasin family protein [Desulfobacter latus]NWH06730.1 phasin family protein [Desulfobacter latus]
MLESIKNTLLSGVGMALRSKKEIETFAKEFAEQSEMNQKEAKDFLEECKKRYDDAKSGLDKKLEEVVESVLKRLDLPTREDVDTLNARIDALSEKIEKDA